MACGRRSRRGKPRWAGGADPTRSETTAADAGADPAPKEAAFDDQRRRESLQVECVCGDTGDFGTLKKKEEEEEEAAKTTWR